MPEKSLFFNSTATDRRKYSSADWSKFMQIFYSTGIVSGGDSLRVIPEEDALAVSVTPGCAIVQGRAYFLEEEPLRLGIPAADPVYARLDRVALRLDLTADVRSVNLKVLTGTPAAEPLPPELVRNENIYDLSLAQIRVAPGALTIDTLTDERYDAELCGICKGLFTEDLSDFFDLENLWEAIRSKGDMLKSVYDADGDGVVDTALSAASCAGNSASASEAEKLSAARTIALSGGATGAPTEFDGSGDITIPVTALDVSKATAGILPVARGGTGQATVQALRNSMGLGNTTGVLPVANGGTGQTSLNNVTVGKANACNGLTFAVASTAPTTVTNNKVTFVYG